MSVEHTVVIRFDGEQPSYSADMECLGGKVVAVAFDGNRLSVEDALMEALQALLVLAEVELIGPDRYPEVIAARIAIARAVQL